MVDYTRSTGGLLVILTRGEEEIERELVLGSADDSQRCGERALLRAIEMLLRQRRLRAGDVLTITSADE